MRLGIWLILFITMSFAKDIKYKIQNPSEFDNRINLIETDGQISSPSNRSMRDDTSTVFLEDFEGDVSGWTYDPEWELTEETSYSPTHSFHMDDDNLDKISSLISPVISVPELGSSLEIFKMNFALWCDLPDADGNGDNYLEDYYWVDIANITDVPVYFNQSADDAYDGMNWWCGDPSIGGYLDGWVQVLQSPTITVPPTGGTLSAMMKWGLEDYAGATVTGSCTDGWDAANVRISNDGGSTWNLLTGDDPYDFDCGFGWIYNDNAYDTGGDLNALAPGWGGQADWHEVTFGLNEYAGEDVVIQFAFGSDPSYSTPNDNTLGGFRVDDITVSAGNGDVVFFDNADDQTSMVPMNAFEFAWEQYFYDYGDNRPGSLGWEEYPPGEPFNGNAQLDISEYAGNDIRIRFTGRMDENDDGGNGNGLFIDDVHVWKVSVNLVPPVTNLTSNAADGSVTVSWDAPPSEQYDNDVIFHHDNSAENAYYWTIPNDIRFGAVYTIPYGAESFTVHSAMFAASHNDQSITDINTVIEGYNVSPTGIPATTPLYSTDAILTSGDLSEVVLDNWVFDGSFLISMTADSNISMFVDEAAETFNSYFKSSDFGSSDWFSLVDDGGGSGEWIINATVSTTGNTVEPEFNVYRSIDGGIYNQTFNGMGLDDNTYVDNFVSNGSEYCYKVEAVYDGSASELAGPTCALPESNTIYQMAYDDGQFETSVNAGPFNTLCVKFTPDAYPVDLYRVSFYCVGSNNGTGLINVWDDDGEGGMPGTLLIENLGLTFFGGWNDVIVSPYSVEITEGSFYVGWMETDQTPPIGVDEDNGPTNSFIDAGLGVGFESFGNYSIGTLMIRAEVDAANALSINDDIAESIPNEFLLKQNYPNPFNPVTTIDYNLQSDGYALITLYDVTGRKIKDMINNYMSAGHYSIKIDGSSMPSGIYYYRLEVKNSNQKSIFSSTRKMALIK